MMSSRNHSLVQVNLGYLLKSLKKYNVFSELSIEINGNEYKPDICIYPKFEIDFLEDDIRMIELPILAIEILSPSQGTHELISKVKIYFAAGIKSVWLVMPYSKSIQVFSSLKTFKVFSEGNLIDNIIGIELPINEIFE